MAIIPPIPRPSSDVRTWATNVTAYLQALETATKQVSPKVVQLLHKTDESKAAVDGLLMFDPVLGVPVYSHNGAWHPLGV